MQLKPTGYHDGDRSEYLAAYAFDTIGYSVPVPRQQDRFLVDLLVHLAEDDDKRRHVPTGIAFAVQVKSDKTPIGVKAGHIDSLRDFMSPLYVCVVDKPTQSVEVFQTLNRIPAVHHATRKALAFFMDGKPPEKIKINKKWVACDPIDLGKPIVSLDLSDLDHPDPKTKRKHRRRFLGLMQGWVILEILALTWRRMNLPFLSFPPYETDQLINFNDFVYATYGKETDVAPACAGLATHLIGFGKFLENDVAPLARGDSSTKAKAMIRRIKRFCSDLRKLDASIQDTTKRLPSSD